MISYQEPVIVIAGPTSSGKSSLALQLAKDINAYIINADSRQIYRELKIGTAQPKPDKKDGDIWYVNNVKHYLYGYVSIKDKYNIYQYQKDVQKVLDKEDGLPILVGGTGLYIDSIIYNYDLESNPKETVKYSRKELEKMTLKKLHSLLDSSVLEKLNRSDRNNPVRLIRAIERGDVNQRRGATLNHIYLLLDRSLESLEKKIRERTNQMLQKGLLEENQNLIKQGFSYDIPAMKSIGYQEFQDYFTKEGSIEEVKEEIILHTLQYAKRQKTWFKRNKDIKKVREYKEAYDEVVNFLSIS